MHKGPSISQHEIADSVRQHILVDLLNDHIERC